MFRLKTSRNSSNNLVRKTKMDENYGSLDNTEVTVVDVYDIASEIGKECEKIIDQYGADTVTSLMPKVITALELLENLATKQERENTQLSELHTKIVQLENDKLEKAEYRQKFEKELETIEEQWRSETKELITLVARLQDENRKLHKETTTTTTVLPTQMDQLTLQELSIDGASGGDILQHLKQTLEKQRDEIRQKENVLQEKLIDIDNLKSQVERLTQSSRELRRKHKSFQSQVRMLCDERADFLIQLQEQQRDITGLRKRLGLAQKENEDLVKCDLPLPSNKAIYDLDDPNRPRFTTQELKDILHERNELKARVSDLEDELENYRPKKSETVSPEEDAPVQGPLPYEPDDAPWKKRESGESGIRKFFRKLFSENHNGSSFPKRSLSTLSKMALLSTTTTNEQIPI